MTFIGSGTAGGDVEAMLGSFASTRLWLVSGANPDRCSARLGPQVCCPIRSHDRLMETVAGELQPPQPRVSFGVTGEVPVRMAAKPSEAGMMDISHAEPEGRGLTQRSRVPNIRPRVGNGTTEVLSLLLGSDCGR